ncbi:bifunctional N(6)-L-threonylcarbamoyladenine synthase/serine/threonine protein kinase [Candidatus Woesearchaeota archaeon]|nr:bifunctional N(6)-L-threonylcarbamoyladenine synthase/serine/threonine protein kinase [Candidatus Woesearchaeota archaeon]
MKPAICLGIETTAHTFGVGIVAQDGKILADVKDSFTTGSGGMIPHEVAEHHVKVCDAVLAKALSDAGIGMSDIRLISFSQSPGIGPCLKIGATVARLLSHLHGIPLIGVNHCIAHLEIARLLTPAKDPVLLYASGANTQIIAFEEGKYRIFGETLDQGIGNLLDSFARHIGLGFPGGPKVEQLALKAREQDAPLIELPYVVKGMDLSFGGILTNIARKWDSGAFTKEGLCFSLQETVFAMLVEVSERAMAHTGKIELAIGGGVGCNKRLQEMCRLMCEARGAQFFAPPNTVLIDNGVMIAWLGLLQYNAGERMAIADAIIKPYLRTDEIEVRWR